MRMRVFLQETREEDYDLYYNIRCSPSDIYWNGHLSKPDREQFFPIYKTRLSASPFEKLGDKILFFIMLSDENNCIPIGFIQFIWHTDAVEIGYSVVEDYQGKGYATEALSKAVQFAEKYKKPIIVRIRDDNIASQRVAKKNGFSPSKEFVNKNYPNAGSIKLRTYYLLEQFQKN